MDTTSPHARIAGHYAITLQERIAPDGALAAIAELGWAD